MGGGLRRREGEWEERRGMRGGMIGEIIWREGGWEVE